jgi:hypothetical protein
MHSCSYSSRGIYNNRCQCQVDQVTLRCDYTSSMRTPLPDHQSTAPKDLIILPSHKHRFSKFVFIWRHSLLVPHKCLCCFPCKFVGPNYYRIFIGTLLLELSIELSLSIALPPPDVCEPSTLSNRWTPILTSSPTLNVVTARWVHAEPSHRLGRPWWSGWRPPELVLPVHCWFFADIYTSGHCWPSTERGAVTH